LILKNHRILKNPIYQKYRSNHLILKNLNSLKSQTHLKYLKYLKNHHYQKNRLYQMIH
jgi:hypothetical protein